MTERILQEHESLLGEHDEALKDHEKRLITMEICFRNNERNLETFKNDVANSFGRLEKSIDTLTEKFLNESKLNSSTRTRVSDIMAIASPVIVALFLYFLK